MIVSPVKTKTYTTEFDKPVIVYPDEETAYTINGYKDVNKVQSNSSENSDQQVSSSVSSTDKYNGKYLGNKNTKTFHTTNCRYIKKTKEENVRIFENLDEATAEGYKSCSVCIK